ncbi:hypothetical protein ACGFYU_00375 [Streptomyces sp. NPDC048337]|uniref:hypothetical protein n=1 Tax=Streptomyces sp. NPDC048337 TaxID=3365535 RepID=UPI0037219F45
MTASAPDALDALRHWRLRPDVAATPLTAGVHLRGWNASVSLEGSPALPKLWRMVEEALLTDGADALAGLAPAGSPLRAALCTLIGQLHAHDLLVEHAALPDEGAARWLRTIAARPAEVSRALWSVRVEVSAAEPGGALARAAVRALEHAGVTASPGADGGPAEGVLLSGTDPSGRVRAVAAVLHDDVGGFVSPVGTPEQARADAAALGDRIRPLVPPAAGGPTVGAAATGGPAPGGPAVDGPAVHAVATGRPAMDGRATRGPAVGGSAVGASGTGPGALGSLLAGAAVHRLLCALGGLPDPAAEGEGGRPAVLVADARPLRAGYHTWLGPGLPAAPAPPATLAEALAGVADLGDERTGVLDAPDPGSLPQLPVALVRCTVPGGTLLAGAARADLARLEALCRAAELRLAPDGAAIVVGADPGHALGRALRRAAAHTAGRTAVGAAADTGWAEHPQARHWWSVLTRRLGIRAGLAVAPIAPGAPAFHALVQGSPAPGAPVRELGRAVEATAADAAAFAAMAAVVRVQAEAQPAGKEPGRRQLLLPDGAVAPLATAGRVRAAWEDEGWTAGWLAAVAAREPALQSALGTTCGLHARPWEPGPAAADADRELWAALRACGFVVLRTGPGHDGGTR